MKHVDRLLLALLVLAFPLSAYAYIDPGTGSYVVQIAIGVILGSAYALKLGWHRLTAFIGRIISRRGVNESR